ncbi:hypothetical protein SLS62_002309 [Diatrype stigma]|uniref:Mid2 domain-containing protein n=1 Tax=Diatrype stigma TaxID=117547 RepID=A0AAN9UWT6_9PEZI
MTLRYSLLSAAIFWRETVQAGGFINPSYTTPYGPGAYQNTRVWRVGEVHEVRFNPEGIQAYNGYTLALWQKGIHGGDTLGPILDRSDTIPTSEIAFNWTVDLADFHLEWSNVYYMWLWDGDNQGNMDFPQVSSAYFNITDGTDEFAPSSTSSAVTTSFTSVSSAPPPSVAPTTTSSEAETPTTEAASSSSSGGSSSDGGGGSLSTGAGIGIGLGVGAGVLGVSGVVCTWLLVRHRRKRQQDGAVFENNRSASMMVPMQGYNGSGGGTSDGGQAYSDTGYIPAWPNKPIVHTVGTGQPIMLDSTPTTRSPAELDGRGMT